MMITCLNGVQNSFGVVTTNLGDCIIRSVREVSSELCDDWGGDLADFVSSVAEGGPKLLEELRPDWVDFGAWRL